MTDYDDEVVSIHHAAAKCGAVRRTGESHQERIAE